MPLMFRDDVLLEESESLGNSTAIAIISMTVFTKIAGHNKHKQHTALTSC